MVTLKGSLKNNNHHSLRPLGPHPRGKSQRQQSFQIAALELNSGVSQYTLKFSCITSIVERWRERKDGNEIERKSMKMEARYDDSKMNGGIAS